MKNATCKKELFNFAFSILHFTFPSHPAHYQRIPRLPLNQLFARQSTYIAAHLSWQPLVQPQVPFVPITI